MREHTLQVRPPRALWVPFALGRPFGAPNQPEQQRRVLEAALRLLERDRGPISEDFPDDATAECGDADMPWVCPVSFPRAAAKGSPALLREVEDEISALAPWYERSLGSNRRTTVGLSGVTIVECARTLSAHLMGEGERQDVARLVNRLRWAAEDLKAYYFEAVMAQPGAATQSDLEDWFWTGTASGRLLLALRETCLKDEQASMRDLGEVMLVPDAYT